MQSDKLSDEFEQRTADALLSLLRVSSRIGLLDKDFVETMKAQMTDMENDPKSSTTTKTTATLARSLLASPPRMPSSQASTQGKERRDPSITPRKFQRFFTPRPRVQSLPSASSRALRAVTASTLNRCPTPSSPLTAISEDIPSDDLENVAASRGSKRRKIQHTPETSPLRPRSSRCNSSPAVLDISTPLIGRPQLLSPIRSLPDSSQSSQDVINSDDMMSDDDLPSMPLTVKRPVTLPNRGMAAQLAQRMTGGVPRGGLQLMRCPVADWRTETADFYSRPEDVHLCPSNEGPGQCIPFSVASCNTNSVVAVGDEEGYIRLLDSNNEFDKVHLSFQAHSNAVIDIAFSDDDYLLATASGDQTGKVFDMLTQTSVASLRHHTASLKQIRFQPGRGNNSVLATSSRDGSVQIWDLRCSGGAPIQEILDRPHSLGYRAPRHIKSGCVVNSIYGAHARAPQHRYQTRQNVNPLPSAATTSTDVGHRGEVPGRAGEVSVTAIQFLPPGREHLLLSASEADATVKLWDIRSVQTGSKSHKHYATPVSYTRQPDSHLSFRPFGISGLALSGDGGRLYALCKDNTVYAYSTPHLILGHAPELSKTAGSEPPRRLKQAGQGGLGPMYGFRHPSFHATSFYIKAAVRPARDGRPEMLAVGSSDGCPVVFPTDERYFRRDLSAGRGAPPNGVDERAAAAGVVMNPAASSFSSDGGMVPRGRPRPGGLTRTNSITNLSARLADTIPIFKPYGTALVRGHDKEVGPLAWTRDGKLVTVGDDYAIRCWGEDREKAADLRRGGEVNGRRWACGWADVGEGWEGDEDDW